MWEDTHEEVFRRAKTALVTAPCLSYPRPDGLFVLDTDASDHAVGAPRRKGTGNLLRKSCAFKTPEEVLHHEERATSSGKILSAFPTLSTRPTIYGSY